MNEKKDLPERSSIRPSTFVYCAKTMMYSQMRKQKEETNCARSSLFREQQKGLPDPRMIIVAGSE
jgi:hypothetical protein